MFLSVPAYLLSTLRPLDRFEETFFTLYILNYVPMPDLIFDREHTRRSAVLEVDKLLLVSLVTVSNGVDTENMKSHSN